MHPYTPPMNTQSLVNLPSPQHAIVIENLRKVYAAQGTGKEKVALEDFSLTIPRGSFFALLGPNGAGKSTAINILAGLCNKTSGTVTIWGMDIDTLRRQSKYALGIVPQEINIDPFFTPFEAMELQAGLYGVPKAQRKTMEILEALGLADKANAYARTLSGGMRRRLMVAKAMVHQPPILVLDEPTAGVDVHLRQQLWEYVKKLNKAGTTILLTTHYLEEAQQLCDEIAIINKGGLVAHDSTVNLLKKLDSKVLTVKFSAAVADIPPVLAAFSPSQPTPDTLRFQFKSQQGTMQAILGALQQANLPVSDLSTEEGDLEDLFLELTGE